MQRAQTLTRMRTGVHLALRPGRVSPPARAPVAPLAATSKKNGGGGGGGGGGSTHGKEQHVSPSATAAHPEQQQERAGTAAGTHPGTTLEFYTAPEEAASPYLADVHAAERHEKGARLARANWSEASESALNEQIGREWALSYTYEAMASAFSEADRALPGTAAYFRSQAEGERAHARTLMTLQATRGGSTALPALAAPDDFVASSGGPDLGPLAGGRGGRGVAGDAIRAFEAALALERLNYAALETLHGVAEGEGDAQFMDAIEDMLTEQAAEVKQAADYVSQLVRAGPGLGEFLFDRALCGEGGSLAVF
jgi:ferritin heavy chain